MLGRSRDRVLLDTRLHGIVLMPTFLRAFALAGGGGFLLTSVGPLPLLGALALIAAAVLALRAVWTWERTRVLVTTDELVLLQGTMRRRTAVVRFAVTGPLEVEQTLIGRALGYGTLRAGTLVIEHVPQPKQVFRLIERLAP